MLEERQRNPQPERWQAYDFRCTEIAIDNYLLTYTLQQEDRLTRHTSIWRRTDTGWKIFFHQGTIAGED